MDAFSQSLKNLSVADAEWKPQIFDFSGVADRETAMGLIEVGAIQRVVDDYEEQLRELFQVDNPTLVYSPEFSKSFDVWRMQNIPSERAYHGKWVYYPWIYTLVHVLDRAEFQRVRTARNRNLISETEQHTYYDATVGIGGLSVGNSVALALVLQGGAGHIRLADFDNLALSNLNRIRSGVDALGLPKVRMTARQIYLLDPYADVVIFQDGITDENIDRFFDGLDIVIDELDTIPVKMRIREEAKKRNIPVLMGADNGDNAVIDIERYDTDPQLKYFHGRLGEATVQDLKGMDKFAIGRTITKMIGPENITERMQESLMQMGKTIVSWPQLGGAAILNGVGVAYCARKILIGETVESDRAVLSLDEKLTPNYSDEASVARRNALSAQFAKGFGL